MRSTLAIDELACGARSAPRFFERASDSMGARAHLMALQQCDTQSSARSRFMGASSMRASTRWALLALCLLGAPQAFAQMISAPATSSTGTFTVSYSSCTQTICYLEERVGQSGAWTYVDGQTVAYYGQTGSVSFSGKPTGIYYYRAVALEFSDLGVSYTGYSPEHVITVSAGPPPVADTLDNQLAYGYEVRQGDINFDGRTDFFVRRTSGGQPGNGSLEAFFLQQRASGSTFDPVGASQSQITTASSWPISAAQATLRDVDYDGFADVVLRNVASVVGGASDQIAYASGQVFNGGARAVRAQDASFNNFVRDVNRWRENPNYFEQNAPIVWVPVYGPVYFCGWYYDYEWGWYYSCGFGIGIIGYVQAYDFSAYSPEAVQARSVLSRVDTRTANFASNSADMQEINSILRSWLGVDPYGGGLLNGAI
ncbi:MAG: hypothetical protein MUE84_04265, partial [Hyphomonas sp.]|nr:hypothetical protein [Hyphomonas sp.]